MIPTGPIACQTPYSTSSTFSQGVRIDQLEAGPNGRVATVKLGNGNTIVTDTVCSVPLHY